MQDPIISVDVLIAADPATVWKAMTRKQSGMFPGTTVETDWQVGHPISFSGDWNGKPFQDFGEIRSFDEGRELSFSHWSQTPQRPENYHVVRYELEPQGTRTKVTLSQSNLGPNADVDEATKAEFRKNWTMMLEGLKKTAEGS
jgi:uncharacterized protein YndB with AHSA1/START domain